MFELNGKTILITGGTDGIGKSAAMVLANNGGQVVIVGRNPEKTAQVVQQIKKVTGNLSTEGLVADLSSMQQVRRLGQEFLQKHQQLHILINNAGGIFATRQITVDGYERTFALNHLAYFLLTSLLLDRIKASAPARIINISSRAHEGTALNFNDLHNEQHYSYGGSRAYGQSKLANILFTYELARQLAGTGVTVNAVHPGPVDTKFGINNGGAMRVGMRIFHQFALTPEQGADTVIYLAASPDVERITGKYWFRRKQVPSSPESYDEVAQKNLWSVSAQLTGVPVAINA